MNGGGMNGCFCYTEQAGENTDTVLGCVGWDCLIEQVRASRKQVIQADGLSSN